MGQGDQDCCPFCGTKLDPGKLIVDLDSNIIALNGKMAHAAARIAEMIYVLNKKFPGVARHEEILSAIYGQGDRPLYPFKNLYACTWSAREIGKKLGFKVIGSPTRGYRLTINESPIP